MMRALLLAFVLLLSAPSSAVAAEEGAWSTTLPADALATYLDGPPARYLLVPAGTEAPELAQAEQALSAALRTSGKAVLVMNAQALGPVAQLDDASIVQRGTGFPVDHVMVLRLFPDASGALTQAVVTLYDTAGQRQGSFSATRGTALAPRPQAPEPKVATTPEPAPVKPAPAAPVKPTPLAPARPSKPGLDPVEEYERQYIGFDELIAIHGQTGTVMTRATLPYEGKFKKPLEGDAFYQKVGRQDLVEAYQSKMTLKTVLGITGGAAMVVGAIVSVSSLTAKDESCGAYDDYTHFNDCIDRGFQRADEKRRTFFTGMGISSAGIGLLMGGLFINPHPITPSEARELADGYNKKLKADLGLSEDGQPIAPPERPATTIQARLSPVFRSDGAGLLLSGTF